VVLPFLEVLATLLTVAEGFEFELPLALEERSGTVASDLTLGKLELE
jgi:hypothetical protein